MPSPTITSFRAVDFDAAELAARKRGCTVSVCLPARNEEDTVGPIVEVIAAALVHEVGLVDELVVIDDHSSDGTADVAAAAGAKVVDASEVLPGYGTGHGKGEALWKSLYVTRGDLVVWCDADVRDFDPGFVVGLLGPLLTRPDLQFVKGWYDRPVGEHGEGGGRVTELTARPVLALLFPELAGIAQPLAGEYAGRRSALEQVPFVQGYGVDIALLIDMAARFGPAALAQVDLGVRRHRNRPLDELAPQATEVLQAALARAQPELVAPAAQLLRPGRPPVTVARAERPPMASVPGYGGPGSAALRA